MKSSIIYKEESYAIIGACFNVYKAIGSGFTEAIYHECLEVEFDHLKLPFRSQPQLPIEYRGKILQHRFQPDFICYEKIILEIKAVSSLCDEHRSQGLNYLNATGFQLALLVNFGASPQLEYERLANTAKLIKSTHNKLTNLFPGGRSDESVYI